MGEAKERLLQVKQSAKVVIPPVPQFVSDYRERQPAVVPPVPSCPPPPLDKSRESLELEAELECPICFDLSRPPIYQVRDTFIFIYPYLI